MCSISKTEINSWKDPAIRTSAAIHLELPLVTAKESIKVNVLASSSNSKPLTVDSPK